MATSPEDGDDAAPEGAQRSPAAQSLTGTIDADADADTGDDDEGLGISAGLMRSAASYMRAPSRPASSASPVSSPSGGGSGPGVGKVDADRLRAMVSRRLFGTSADPVRIGRFAVLRRLGAGGMGVVYSGFDEQLDRKVAIKLLRGRDDEASRTRLMREAQALARLSHPNVIQVYEVGTHDGQVFVAMEFVKGPTLTDWKPDAAMAEVLDVYIQAGRGLAAAHAAGLVHRDFKPDNVLVGDDGRVRVLDFGLARAAELETTVDDRSELDEAGVSSRGSLDTQVTRTGATTGTPAYMSPEQHRGEHTDERTDQFSFCVALWERLYGERPFAGKTVSEIAIAVTEGNMREPPAGKKIPGWLRRALTRGLAVSASDRWPDMNALLDHLAVDRRRHRRMGIAAAVVLALGGGAIAFGSVTRQRDVCPGPSTYLEGIWDAPRAAAVERAFRATEAPYAADAYRGTAAMLDDYGRRWAEMQVETCELTAQAAERGGGASRGAADDAELIGRRMVCLSQRRHELEQLVQLLSRADAATVRSAVQAASDLPDLAACQNERSLLAYDSTVGEVDRARLEFIGDLLASGRNRLVLGRYEEGLGFAQKASAEAESAGHLPSQARAAFLEGSLRSKLGDHTGAEREFARARRLADRAGDDETRAEALVGLVREVGVHGGDDERGRALAEDAWAALERLGSDPRLEATLHSHLGSLAGAQAEWDEAISEHREALALWEKTVGDESTDVAVSLNNLANALFASGQLAEAERMHRRALATFEKLLGPNHPYVAISLSNVANAIQAQAQASPDGDVKAAALRAEPLYRRAIEIRREAFGPSHALLATPYNNLAEALRNAGRLEAAVEAYEKAVDIKRRTYGDVHPKVSVSLTGLGQAQLARGDAEAARETLELAREGQGENEPHPEYRAATDFTLARALLALDVEGAELERARELAETSRKDYAAAGPAYAADLAEVDAFLAGLSASSP